MSNINRACNLSVSLMLVLLTLLGCVPQEEVIEIQVGKDITSLKVGEGEAPGQSETIEVQALTDKGKNAPFTIETEGDCVSVSSAKDSITVVAGAELCEQTITIKSGSAPQKTITVIVYDPMVMDIGEGLLIRYVNEYAYMWDDRGSGGDNNVTFWNPITEIKNGWYPLGSLIVNHYDDVNSPMIVVKDSKGAGLLREPKDYVKIWDDSGTGVGGDKFLSVWKAVCPEGFVAFGVVAHNVYANNDYEKPPQAATRCVKKEYTAPASIGGWIYDDKGTGKTTGNLEVRSIGYPEYLKSPDGRAALLTGVSVGCPNYGAGYCDTKLVNMLLVPLPVYSHSENMTAPSLTERAPLDTSIPRFFSSVRVPFTLIPSESVNAPPARVKQNIEKSPFYFVQREEMYTSIDIMNNSQGKKDAVYHYQISTGYSQTDQEKFSHEVGAKITAGGECSFLGSGGKWEVELNYKFGWEKSVSNTYSQATTRDFTFTVPAGAYAEIVQVTNQFRAIPDSDEILSTGVPFNMNSNIIMYLQYPND